MDRYPIVNCMSVYFPFSVYKVGTDCNLYNIHSSLSIFFLSKGSCLQCFKCSGDITECNSDAGIEICAAGSRCASMVLNSADSMHFMFGCAKPLDCEAARAACTEVTKDGSQITCNATCCNQDRCVTPYSKSRLQIQS